jgi:hypothetical protein
MLVYFIGLSRPILEGPLLKFRIAKKDDLGTETFGITKLKNDRKTIFPLSIPGVLGVGVYRAFTVEGLAPAYGEVPRPKDSPMTFDIDTGYLFTTQDMVIKTYSPCNAISAGADTVLYNFSIRPPLSLKSQNPPPTLCTFPKIHPCISGS